MKEVACGALKKRTKRKTATLVYALLMLFGMSGKIGHHALKLADMGLKTGQESVVSPSMMVAQLSAQKMKWREEAVIQTHALFLLPGHLGKAGHSAA